MAISQVTQRLATPALFWAVTAVVMGGGLWVWVARGYEQSFLDVNTQRWAVADLIMPHLTHLGDARLVGALAVALCVAWGRTDRAWLVVIVLVIMGLITPLIKNGFFPDWQRPAGFYPPDGPAIFLPEGASLRRKSMPSGHTLTAVAALGVTASCACLARWGYVALALLALTVGYSRIYLGAHFLGDVVVGWAVATGVTLLLVALLGPMLHRASQRLGERLRKNWHRCLTAAVVLSAALGIFARYFS